LGFAIDRIGKRVLIMTISSLMFIATFTTSMLMPKCDEPCYREVYPLILLGFAYTVYASVIWGSIPYAVEPRNVGTAFGICTAI